MENTIIATGYYRVSNVVLLFILYFILILDKILGGKLSPYYLDDIVLLFFFIQYIFVANFKEVFFKLLVAYILYSLFLIYTNRLPIKMVIQIFLNLKFYIVFLLFISTTKHNTSRTKFSMFLYFGFYLLYFYFLELVNPTLIIDFLNAKDDGRGLLGYTTVSLLGSRVFLSEFLVILIILMCNNIIKVKKIYIKYLLVFIIFSFLFLTYSRKEMLFGFIVIILSFRDDLTVQQKMVFYTVVIPTVTILFIISFIKLFGDVNKTALSGDYIRFLLIMSAISVFMRYFPFGSGPGTYGSVMSISYRKVYDELGISTEIVGTESNPGPIYDAYIFNILAEYGIGIILYFLIAYNIYKKSLFLTVDNGKAVRSLLVFSIFLSLTTPVLTNFMGIILFSTIAILLNEERIESSL